MPQETNQSLDAMQSLLNIMTRLRDPDDGCPWDLRQSWQSLFPYTLEEVHEVGAAIDSGNPDELCDELGDLLLQIVFFCQIAREQDLFDLNTVANVIGEKMIRRHPHIFGETSYANEQEQADAWEQIKQEEREEKSLKKGYFADIPQGMPALMRSVKLKKRASRFGFDWHDWEPVAAKVREELQEVEDCIANNQGKERLTEQNQGKERLTEEVGDLLMATANLSKQLKVDPENALRMANNKFERRVDRLRELLSIEGNDHDFDDQALDDAWERVKAEEKA